MGKNRERKRPCAQMGAGIIALMAILFSVGTARAASVLNSCTTYCHGASPQDGARKANPHFGSQSSAFLGNHRNHLPAVATAASCSICHTPVTSTSYGHQNNVINMANSLKGYSSATLRAKYDKGVFFNQTSIPNLTNARCSNVNCHFEKQTPVWGSSPTATTCETCHGALVSPLTLAHSKHIVALGNTIAACTSCHNNYAGASAYAHATSAGRPIKVTVGAYTGSNSRYLPSQASGRLTGTCSSVVCHGSGTQLPWSGTLWSTTDQCGKCHSSTTVGAVSAGTPFYSTSYPTKVTAVTDPKAGAHTAHITSTDSLSAVVDCNACHGTVTLTAATHMNGTTNFTWSTLATKNGALAPAYSTTTRACSNVYCHGASMPGGDTSGTNRAPVWNVAFLSATLSRAACASCHGFPPPTTAGHPAVTIPATWPAAGAATGALGTTCSCHANINTTGTTYANIFVNKAQHIDGTLQVSGGHAVPYDTHNAAIVTAGGNTACLGCHAMGTSASVYPAAGGAAPNCMSCHKKAAPLHTGTTAGANCSSCHGVSTTTTAGTKGIPAGTAFPDVRKGHSRSDHRVVCTTCHVLGASGGTGSGVNHGRGSTAGPVRDGKPHVVGPAFVTGVTVTGGGVKGTSPTSVSCNHNIMTGSGCSGNGTKTW